jgi:hypothetical protein
MSLPPDDQRHGTKAGYRAGCREDCCREAEARYERIRIYHLDRGNPYTLPVFTVQRRIRALQAIGWRAADIAEAAGWKAPQVVLELLEAHRTRVGRDAYNRICRAYDQLSMQPGPSQITAKRAARRGALPPLAWDDDTIDNPDAKPAMPADDRDSIDEVLIQRALNGIRVKANPAERAEIERRWLAAGRPLNELARTQGTNIWRDRRTA